MPNRAQNRNSLGFLAAVCLLAGIGTHAQVAPDNPLHLAHVEGYVVTSAGQPLVNAEVTLDRDGKAVYRVRTNSAGAFRFNHVLGSYLFRVQRTQYAPAEHEIHVGDLIPSYVERKKLYVIVGPGACADACSPIFTSKRDFERELKRRTHKPGEKP